MNKQIATLTKEVANVKRLLAKLDNFYIVYELAILLVSFL